MSKRKDKKAKKAGAAEAEAVAARDAPAPTAPAGGEEEGDLAAAKGLPAWGHLWQVPAIVLSSVLIGAGIYVTMDRPDPVTIDELLDQTEHAIGAMEFDEAALLLNEDVREELPNATPAQQSRFHAVVADWIALVQQAQEASLLDNHERIAEHYGKAADLGLTISPARLDRWARSLLEIGDVEGARARLSQLDALAASDANGAQALDRRNDIYRLLIEYALRRPDGTYEQLMGVLSEYRSDQLLALPDEWWAVAREAEVRMRFDRPREAIDHLLVEMRRLEHRSGERADRRDYGELYLLLGEAYATLSIADEAAARLEQASDLLAAGSSEASRALVARGRLAVGAGLYEDALTLFDQVLLNGASGDIAIDAQIGRAEVQGILGEHVGSIEDLTALQKRISTVGAVKGAALRDRLTEVAINRHDARVATADLENALAYIEVAQSIYGKGEMPDRLVLRLASTHRAMADDLLARGREALIEVKGESAVQSLLTLPAELRHRANKHYKNAAQFAIKHARQTAGMPSEEHGWTDSLWLAADSYDLAGMQIEAAELFREYVAARGEGDPRRPEAQFRLGQAHQALMQYEEAAAAYQALLQESPRSTYATQAFVPFARCYVELDRKPEAEQLLASVVQGQRTLLPEAQDYQDALIELGRIRHDRGDWPGAVQAMSEAVQRYPSDPRTPELHFRIGDCYLNLAGTKREELQVAAMLSPSERQGLEAGRTQYLAQALAHFSSAVNGLDDLNNGYKSHEERELHRQAALSRADTAFELGQYENAALHYDEVARRYAEHQSSMMALVQIVNCYYALGEKERARTAEQRARVRLQQLPDEAFSAENALLSREAWERWLNNSPPGTMRTANATDED